MRMFILMTLLLVVPNSFSFAEMHLSFCYDPYPPYTIEKNKKPIGGLKVQLLQAIVNKIDGVDAEVKLCPWKRCQKMAKTGVVDGILPLFKNDEREQYLLFTESCWEQKSVFWYKKSKYPDGISWDTFEDISHLRLGMLRASFLNKEMENAFEAKNGIHRVTQTKQLFDLLLKERVDLVGLDAAVGRYIIHQKGWQKQIAAVIKPIDVKEAYLGISKKSQAASLIGQFNQAIRMLKQNGTVQAIIESSEY